MYIVNNYNKSELQNLRGFFEGKNLCQIFIFSILLILLIAPWHNISASSSVDLQGGAPGGVVDGVNHGFSKGGVLDTIFNTLASLTCETQGVGNLLRSEFSHTCIAESLFTYAIANIVSPGLYANTFLRLTMRDEDMFPGNCSMPKRAAFDDPRISFGMCSNTKLAIERAGALAGVGLEIVKTLFVDGDAWAGIISAWNLPKEKYHNIYRDEPVGFTDYMFDIGIIPIFPIQVTQKDDRICVSTQSFTGWIPIGCKYINEPYPKSIYADFFDPNADLPNGVNTSSLTKCAEMGSCYRRAHDNSHAAVVFSGPVIECVQEMIAKLMISRAVCSFDDVSAVLGSDARATSSLFKFQQNMHKIVNALLAIYIILFGFKIVLSGNVPEKKELLEFVAKFLFVVYFSVGININPGSDDDLTRLDGMIQWAFPLLLGGMTGISRWIANANTSQLCNFNDMIYPVGLEHLGLWDALDCRVSHYLGLDRLLNLFSSMRDMDGGFNNADSMRFPIPSYFFLFIPAIVTGIPFIVLAVLAYPLLIISLLGFIVNATVVCMIGIVILAVLAPLIVPAYLFNMTKGYFVTWAKLLVSFMLQPMVITAFLVAVLEVNDYGMYSTCKYIPKDTTIEDPSVQEQAIDAGFGIDGLLPTSGRLFRMFDIDVDWKGYASEDEARLCQESLGFFMEFPIEAIEGTANEMELDANGHYTKRHGMHEILLDSPGLFFDMVELIFDNFKKWLIQMITMTLLIYLMTQFADQLAEFAADMTEGASISGMAIKPNAIGSAAKKAIKAALKAVKQAIDIGIVAATAAVSVATAGVGSVPTAAAGVAVRTATTAVSTAAKVAGKAAVKAAETATKATAKVATKAAEKVATNAPKSVTNAAKSVANTAKSVANTAKNAGSKIRKAANTTKNMAEKVKDKAQEKYQDAKDKVKEKLNMRSGGGGNSGGADASSEGNNSSNPPQAPDNTQSSNRGSSSLEGKSSMPTSSNQAPQSNPLPPARDDMQTKPSGTNMKATKIDSSLIGQTIPVKPPKERKNEPKKTKAETEYYERKGKNIKSDNNE